MGSLIGPSLNGNVAVNGIKTRRLYILHEFSNDHRLAFALFFGDVSSQECAYLSARARRAEHEVIGIDILS